jgi:hypothetical protein
MAGVAGSGSSGRCDYGPFAPNSPFRFSVLQFDRQDLIDQACQQVIVDAKTIADISI